VSGTPKTPNEPPPVTSAIPAVAVALDFQSFPPRTHGSEATENKEDVPQPPTRKSEESQSDKPEDANQQPAEPPASQLDLHLRSNSPPAIHPAFLNAPPAGLQEPSGAPASGTTFIPGSTAPGLLPSPIISVGNRQISVGDIEEDDPMGSESEESESIDDDANMESGDSLQPSDDEDDREYDAFDIIRNLRSRGDNSGDDAYVTMDEDAY